MKTTTTYFVFVLPLLLCPSGCKTDTDDMPSPPSASAESHLSRGGATSKPSRIPTPSDASGWAGKIVETMDGGGYTYVHLDTGAQQVWVAGPSTKGLAVGQQVTTPQGALMQDFRSETLDRVFPAIYFVSAIHGGATSPGSETGTRGSEAVNPNTAVHQTGKVEGVTKVEDGYTVEEIFKKIDELSGKVVKVRGKVVKFSSAIMGTNWAHIQDGTGSGDTADLTITTDSVVKVGDIIVVEGQLTANKDLGAGYKYAAIIERAKVTKN